MQHIYSHAQNLGKHVAALGTYGLISNHNIRARWTRSSFDSNSLFAQYDNLMTLCQNRTRARPTTSGQKLVTWFACLSVVSCLRLRFLSSIFGSVNADAPFSIGWQLTGQTPRLFSPLRILLTSTNTTCGTLCWSYSFT